MLFIKEFFMNCYNNIKIKKENNIKTYGSY